VLGTRTSRRRATTRTGRPARRCGSAADREALLQGLYDGTIDAIATDHSPVHADEKELDFAEAPSGVVGLETAVSLAIDRLLHGKVIGIMQLVRLLSTGPAAAFNLPGGSLKVGTVADLTLLDLRARRTVNPSALRLPLAQHPVRRRPAQRGPAATIVGGKIVWQARS